MSHVTELSGLDYVRISSLLDSSPYPLALCDKDGCIIQAGQALCAQTGISPVSLIGSAIQNSLPSLGSPQLLGQLDQDRWLYAWLRPLADPSLEEQQKQTMLQNHVFRSALEQVGLYVFLYRIEQDEIRLLTPIGSINEEEIVRKGGPELISSYLGSSEEDTLFLADAFANAAFGRSTTLDLADHSNHADQWLRITLSPIVRETGMIGSLIGTLQNITNLKLAEQHVSRNTAFHNNVLSGISSGWELDMEQNTWAHIWNGEPALSFLGTDKLHYDCYDAFLQESLRPLIHPDDWDNFTAVMDRGALLARFRRGEHSCSEEYRIRSRPTGKPVYEWRNITVRLARDPITLHPKASGHVTDITPQKAKELEAQREKLNMENAAREAQLVNARKSQFLADTSRFLHTPLRAMGGILELALSENMSDTAREYIEQIHDFSKDLTQLLSIVLAQTDDTTQTGISTLGEYSPQILLEKLKTIAETRMDHTATLQIHLEGQIPARLYGDEMRLLQALLHLCLSAMQVTPDLQLSLSCTAEDEEHITMQFLLVDSNTVLSDLQLDNLFVAFAQLGSHYGGGTGLGLSLARQIIRLMDGELTAESIPNGGIRFMLTVPQRVIDSRPI